jgi:hypothetical protein
MVTSSSFGVQRRHLWLALSGDLEKLLTCPRCHDATILRILASKAGYEFLVYYRTRYSSVTRFLCSSKSHTAYRTTSIRALSRLFQEERE